MASIPDPEFFHDSVEGTVYELPGGMLIAIGTPPASLAEVPPMLSGSLVVRYGLSLLSPPGEIIVPGLFAAEKGGMLVGREAWDYLQNNFQVHPRADVVGVRFDGKPVQVYVRELDFGVPVHVLIYENEQASSPAGEANGLVVN